MTDADRTHGRSCNVSHTCFCHALSYRLGTETIIYAIRSPPSRFLRWLFYFDFLCRVSATPAQRRTFQNCQRGSSCRGAADKWAYSLEGVQKVIGLLVGGGIQDTPPRARIDNAKPQKRQRDSSR